MSEVTVLTILLCLPVRLTSKSMMSTDTEGFLQALFVGAADGPHGQRQQQLLLSRPYTQGRSCGLCYADDKAEFDDGMYVCRG